MIYTLRIVVDLVESNGSYIRSDPKIVMIESDASAVAVLDGIRLFLKNMPETLMFSGPEPEALNG